MILLDGNPTTNISALRKVQAVIKNGEIVRHPQI